MAKINKLPILTALAAAIMNMVLCADFFESLLLNLQCYGTEQPGCNTEFTDAHPEVAWSYLNLTKATTHFYMFTNANPDKPELMHKCGGELPPDTTFNPKCPTEIYLPGYASGICNFAVYRELKNERLKSGCYNVLLVDWMWGNFPDLAIAKLNVPIVAKQVVIVIRYLKEKFELTGADFILTGHSFGAHMAGLIGQEEPIGKIIGLDPAGGPYTESTPLDERLDKDDADCVEVLHCSGGPCLPFYFGINITCGTVDFFINGGQIQKSCYQQTLKSFIKQDFIYGFFSLFPPACYHLQCLYYYKATMNPTNCTFIGSRCSSKKNFRKGRCRNCGSDGRNCLVMGINTCDCLTNDKKFKSYYLNTRDDCPYCDNSGLRTQGYNCSAAN